jgi:trans-feruloyl-CoA hydratase/vanillin synthase
MSFNYRTIEIRKEEAGITWLILNRPDQRNAMSPELHAECNDALEKLELDADTKVLILTGAGDAFCGGQDLKLFFRGTENDPKARAQAVADSHEWRWTRLSRFPKPTIAMVNGYCFGGAFTQLIACDLAITADEATFGLSEVNWGIIPGGIVAWNVASAMNNRDAMYYSITGDPFDGKKAAAMGLVNFSVPGEKLREETLAVARKLAGKNPATVRAIKDCVRSVPGMSEAQAIDYLHAKMNSLTFSDRENGQQEALKQFIDEKSFKPGFGNYRRKTA